MSRIIRCDRCLKDIKDHNKVGFVGMLLRNVKNEELVGNNPFEAWDVCEDCMEEVYEFIRNGKLEEKKVEEERVEEEKEDFEDYEEEDQEEDQEDCEEEQEEPAAEEIPEIKAQPTSKGKIDYRKMRDLAREGKTDQQIAEYFGVDLKIAKMHKNRAIKMHIEGTL